MESKIQFVSLWLRQNKRFTVNLLLLLILARFSFLICYNWYHGNTGAPGVQYYVDSYRYMDGAQNLLNGTPFGHKEAEYIGYIALLAFVKWLSMPMVTVVGLQVVFALLSAWFLFDLAKKRYLTSAAIPKTSAMMMRSQMRPIPHIMPLPIIISFIMRHLYWWRTAAFLIRRGL